MRWRCIITTRIVDAGLWWGQIVSPFGQQELAAKGIDAGQATRGVVTASFCFHLDYFLGKVGTTTVEADAILSSIIARLY